MRQRAVLHGLTILAVLAGAYMFFVLCPTVIYAFGFDAHSYWGFPRIDLYAGTTNANGMGVYRYAPAFAPLLEVFSHLDWSTFAVLWLALLVATSMWLAGRWWLLVLAFPPLIFEFYMGNIHLLLAAAIVLGFRYPATWSFVLLTKVTPGVGLLWFAVRREWRALVIALGVTAAVVVGGWLLAPAAWNAWFASLAGTADATGTNHLPVPLLVRLPAAAALVIWGARTDRRWTVVVAAMLGLPTLWTHGFALLLGVIPLADRAWATGSPAARLRHWLANALRTRRRPAPSGAPA